MNTRTDRHARRSPCCAALIAAACGTHAPAQTPRESVQFPLVDSNGILNSGANALRSNTFVGGYPLGRITFSGTLTSMHTQTWRTDSRILVTLPNNATAVIQPFASGTTYTVLTFNNSMFASAGLDPAGLWTFRFFENLDDGGTAAIDAQWNITITLTDDPPFAPAATNLGTVLSPGLTSVAANLSASQVVWYRFTIPWNASATGGTFLDIDTFGSTVSANSTQFPDDTQFGLFDASGMLIASDDDSGPTVTSQLSFGAGTRPARPGGEPYDGRNGPLGPGEYYLAVGAFRTHFANQYWQVTPTSTRTGNIILNFATNLTAQPPSCYPNCDSSTGSPRLTANDFQCFLNKFAAGDTYANCDASTGTPTLTANDFQCFLNRYAGGCR